jgi:inosine/xanthosine triphosphate pyrophosphatase family protein
MAELSDVEKDAISHRGHALRALVAWLRRQGEQSAA